MDQNSRSRQVNLFSIIEYYFLVVVQIHVMITDGQGSNRKIQPLRVQVQPKLIPQGVTMEEIL